MSIYKTTDELETQTIYKLHTFGSRKTPLRDFAIANIWFATKIVLRYTITKSRRRGFRYYSYYEQGIYGIEAYVKDKIPRLSNI